MRIHSTPKLIDISTQFFFTLSRFIFMHLKDEGEDHIYREISILVGNNVTLNLRLIIT